ncbi:MAG: PQQ-binding-like beta-propeller repeat protein [Thermoanaerobaculia bacterium]
MQVEGTPTGRLAAARDCVLSFLGSQTLGCVEPSLGRIRWTRQSPKEWSSARPYLQGDTVLVAAERQLSAFRLSDGSLEWSQSLEGTIRGIGSAGGVLYIGTLKGAVYAWPPPARP